MDIKPSSRLRAVVISLCLSVISLPAAAWGVAPLPVVTVQSYVNEGLIDPDRVATDSEGRIYVTDPRTRCVYIYDAYGRLENRIHCEEIPSGVAGSTEGRIIVSQGSYVALIDAQGKVLRRLGNGPAGQLFGSAAGIAVTPSGDIYVADAGAGVVHGFTPAGDYRITIGTSGTGTGQLSSPVAVAYEKLNGHVVVADGGINSRVVFFTESGTYVKTLGASGGGPLKFNPPCGVAFDYGTEAAPFVRMYVLDRFQGNIQAIDPSSGRTDSYGRTTWGVFLSYIGSYGTANGQLDAPSDIAFDSRYGRLLVANGTGNVTIYGIDGGASPVRDTTPPDLFIDPVAAVSATAELSLTGDVEAGASVTVAVGGAPAVAAGVDGTRWSSTLVLQPGANVITVRATDSFGNLTVKDTSVTYLLPAPALTLDPPVPYSAQASVTVTGTADEGSYVTVSVNGGDPFPAEVTGSAWSAAVSLAEGTNTIAVAAAKAFSHSAGAAASVTLDTASPQLLVSALPDGSYTRSAVQNIEGSVFDEHLAVVTVNGAEIQVVDGLFSTAVILDKPANVIAVIAADLAGNITSELRTINFDPGAPVIDITSPADGSYTQSATLTVSGSLDEPAELRVAGIPVAVAADGSWSVAIELVSGLNTIDVIATDRAGNSAAAGRSVILDTAAPAVAITTPGEDIATFETALTVAGTASDSEALASVTATVNGAPAAVSYQGGSWSLLAEFPLEGSYSVLVTASDLAGNTSSAARTILHDRTPPALSVDPVTGYQPAEVGGITEAGSVVSVSDSAKIHATLTAVAPAWRVGLSGAVLDPASATASATDAAGNRAIKPILFKVPDGDLDMDGIVTKEDAHLAVQIAAKKDPATAEQLAHGDVGPLLDGKPNPDGRIDHVDALLILKKALGQVTW